MKHLGTAMVVLGALALILPGAPPPWVALALVGAGLAHSLAWRSAGARRVSSKERKRWEVRLRNAEKRERNAARRERRLLTRVRRTEEEVKLVLARSVDMDWARKMADAVRQLQAAAERHEGALRHSNMLQQKTEADFTKIFEHLEGQ